MNETNKMVDAANVSKALSSRNIIILRTYFYTDINLQIAHQGFVGFAS